MGIMYVPLKRDTTNIFLLNSRAHRRGIGEVISCNLRPMLKKDDICEACQYPFVATNQVVFNKSSN